MFFMELEVVRSCEKRRELCCSSMLLFANLPSSFPLSDQVTKVNGATKHPICNQLILSNFLDSCYIK